MMYMTFSPTPKWLFYYVFQEFFYKYTKYVGNIPSILGAKEPVTETRNILLGKNGYGYSKYGLNLDGGKPNAFLHIYLAANMTDVGGEKETRKFLTAREAYTRPQYYNNFYIVSLIFLKTNTI